MELKAYEIHRALQKHLDKQPVGFPATKNGADQRLLKRLFTPEEAQVALKLSYKEQSLEEIYRAFDDSDMSLEKTEALLDAMAEKLVIGFSNQADGRRYFLIPLIVGMYEGQMKHLTPELISDFEAYVSEKAFGISFLATELPQMRTIPIGKSITPKHHVASYDQLERLIEASGGPFVINPCICREVSAIKGKPCQKTKRKETCLALGNVATRCIAAKLGREIKKEEALGILRENEAEGLVFQPSNSQKAEFVCACCGCCCGMLSIHKMLPRPLDYWASNFISEIDSEACTGCGACVERCAVNAIFLSDSTGTATINPNRCIGCGNCVPTCPSEAIRLVKKDREVEPPSTSDELYEIIMANKKGAFGKMKLAARLMLKKGG